MKSLNVGLQLAAKFFALLAAMVFSCTVAAASNPNSDLAISAPVGQDAGIARAFYYGNTTVVEFTNYPMYFSVEDEQGNQITNFKRDGKFARIPGRKTFLAASVDGTPVTMKVPMPERPAVKAKANMPGMDFSYDLSGDAEAMPLRIFDDGRTTYFQFKKDSDVPITFAELGGKATVLKLSSDPSNQTRTFDGLQPSFQFVLGQYTAIARYTGIKSRKPQDMVTVITEDKDGRTAKVEQLKAQATAKEPVQTSLPSPSATKVATIDVSTTPPAKVEQTWSLTGGHTVLQDLKTWADKAGWKVIWNLAKDWTVPANTSYSGDFPKAAGDVIQTLAANGALIRAQFYEGNKTLVVSGHGVAAQ